MAIIKTLRLQAFILLALSGAVQSMMNKAPAPTFLASFAGDAGTHVPEVEGDKCTKTDVLTMTCTSGGAPTQFLAFMKDGKAEVKDWKPSNNPLKDTLPKDASSYGIHTCASSESQLGLNPTNATDKVSMKCTICTSNDVCTGNAAIGKSSHCKDGKCACEYGGDLGSCKVCKEGTNEGCTEEGKPRCDSGKSCEQCKLTPSNDGCKGKKPVCLGLPHKCYACTDSVEDNNGCKKDTYCQKDGSCTADKPSGGDKSSAGTVTSTACLVIASIVVALMI